jgi:hypothetical protein
MNKTKEPPKGYQEQLDPTREAREAAEAIVRRYSKA